MALARKTATKAPSAMAAIGEQLCDQRLTTDRRESFRAHPAHASRGLWKGRLSWRRRDLFGI